MMFDMEIGASGGAGGGGSGAAGTDAVRRRNQSTSSGGSGGADVSGCTPLMQSVATKPAVTASPRLSKHSPLHCAGLAAIKQDAITKYHVCVH